MPESTAGIHYWFNQEAGSSRDISSDRTSSGIGCILFTAAVRSEVEDYLGVALADKTLECMRL